MRKQSTSVLNQFAVRNSSREGNKMKGLCHSCLDSDVEITEYKKGNLLCKNCIFKREEKKNES
jgi:hypothetical protein